MCREQTCPRRARRILPGSLAVIAHDSLGASEKSRPSAVIEKDIRPPEKAACYADPPGATPARGSSIPNFAPLSVSGNSVIFPP